MYSTKARLWALFALVAIGVGVQGWSMAADCTWSIQTQKCDFVGLYGAVVKWDENLKIWVTVDLTCPDQVTRCSNTTVAINTGNPETFNGMCQGKMLFSNNIRKIAVSSSAGEDVKLYPQSVDCYLGTPLGSTEPVCYVDSTEDTKCSLVGTCVTEDMGTLCVNGCNKRRDVVLIQLDSDITDICPDRKSGP